MYYYCQISLSKTLGWQVISDLTIKLQESKYYKLLHIETFEHLQASKQSISYNIFAYLIMPHLSAPLMCLISTINEAFTKECSTDSGQLLWK